MTGKALESSRLSKAAKQHLAGIVLFSDPTYGPKEKIDAVGSQYGTHGGIMQSLRKQGFMDGFKRYSSPYNANKQLIKSFCLSNDVFCDMGFSGKVHTSYADKDDIMRQSTSQLEQFIISAE